MAELTDQFDVRESVRAYEPADQVCCSPDALEACCESSAKEACCDRRAADAMIAPTSCACKAGASA